MNTLDQLIKSLQNDILNPIINLLFVLATLMFLWGMVQYVVGSQGDETKLKKGRQIMIWGIFGMFIMASAWGIVKILCQYFGTCN